MRRRRGRIYVFGSSRMFLIHFCSGDESNSDAFKEADEIKKRRRDPNRRRI
jgi:hypothetical protein